MRKKQTVRQNPELVVNKVDNCVIKDRSDSVSENKSDAKMEAEVPSENEINDTNENKEESDDEEVSKVENKDMKEEGETKVEIKKDVGNQELQQKEDNSSGLSDTDVHDEAVNTEKNLAAPVQKRGRGRPRKREMPKLTIKEEGKSEASNEDGGGDSTKVPEKRGRGRPRKIIQQNKKDDDKLSKQKESESRNEKSTSGSESPKDRSSTMRVTVRKDIFNTKPEIEGLKAEEEQEEIRAPRKRGRPAKSKPSDEDNLSEKRPKLESGRIQSIQKRGRGRPKKTTSSTIRNQIQRKRGRPFKSHANLSSESVKHLIKQQNLTISKTLVNQLSVRGIVRGKAKLQKLFREDLIESDKKSMKRSNLKTSQQTEKNDDSDESENVNVEETSTLIEITPEKSYAANGDQSSDMDDDDDDDDEDEDDEDDDDEDSNESESSSENYDAHEKTVKGKMNKIPSKKVNTMRMTECGEYAGEIIISD